MSIAKTVKLIDLLNEYPNNIDVIKTKYLELLAEKALLDSEKDPEEERIKKEQQKKEKRDQYNAERREKRLQDKQALQNTV